MKRPWLWFLAGLVVAGAVFGGMRFAAQRKAQAAAASDLKRYITQPVQRTDVSLTVSGNGPVAAAVGVNVKPQQTGTVDKVLAKNGDKVQANQPILVVHNSNVVDSLASAQAALQQAQDALATALNVDPVSLQQAQQKVNGAQATLSQRQVDSGNLTIAAPAAGVVVATNVQTGDSVNAGTLVANIFDDQHPQVVLNVPQYIADSQQVGNTVTVAADGASGTQTATLTQVGPVVTATGHGTQVPLTYRLGAPMAGLKPGAAAHATLKDQDGADYIAYGAVSTTTITVRAQVSGQVTTVAVNAGDRVSSGATLATLKNDSLQAQLTQAQSDLAVAQSQLNNLTNPTNAPNNNIAQLQIKLKAAQTDLTAKQEAVDQLTVRAPMAGTISSLSLNPGDSVSSSTAAFRVADYGTMNVGISIDELDISRVKLGQTAQVTLDALPGKPFTAKVTQIDSEGVVKNDIANFGVTLTFDQTQGLLAGMNAVANIVVDTRKSVIAVPVASVLRRGPNYSVRVLENGQPKVVQVKVGLTGNDMVEITEGLTEGQKVIVAEIQAKSGSGGPSFGGGGFGGGGFGGGGPGGGGPSGGAGQVRSSTGGGQRGN